MFVEIVERLVSECKTTPVTKLIGELTLYVTLSF